MPIRFGTYDICNGRNRGLESELRGTSWANMDLGIFQETKVTNDIYTHGSAGYSVVAMDAPSRHCGRVEFFHRPAPHFALESVQKFGPNVVGFHLVTGARRWYIVGCYLAPDDTLTIESVVAALKERPRGPESNDDTLYHRGVVGGEVTSHDVPPPLPRRQLGANDVGP